MVVAKDRSSKMFWRAISVDENRARARSSTPYHSKSLIIRFSSNSRTYLLD